MQKNYPFSFMVSLLTLFCLTLFMAAPGFAVTPDGSAYTIENLPVSVSPSATPDQNWISGSFRLRKDAMPNKDLAADNFMVFEDTLQQTDHLTIIAPDDTDTRTVDFVFVLDVTGSMGGEINAVKNNIKAFADNLNKSIDYRLSLVTFRDDVIIDSIEKYNPSKGEWTHDVDTFKAWVSETKLGWGGDWPEGSFEAVGKATEHFSFRKGAQKFIILVTDAASHSKGDDTSYVDPSGSTFDYDQATLISALQAGGFVCYVAGPANTQFKGPGSITEETGGKWYSITSSFTDILDDIKDDINNTYKLSYLSSALPGTHTLKIGIDLPGYEDYRSNPQKFIIGAAPLVTLTGTTQGYVDTGWTDEGSDIPISVNVTDAAEPFISDVTLYYRATGETDYQSAAMTKSGGNVYSATVPASYVTSPGVDFYVTATDGERRGTSPASSPVEKPWQISVVNHPPVIGDCVPATYDVESSVLFTTEITDPDDDMVTGTLFFRKYGDTADFNSTPLTASGSTFSAEIPADYATGSGIEIKVEAKDERDGASKKSCLLKPVKIPVLIKSATKLYDTKDTEGPYSVRAIVLAADTVTLHYTVDGGEEQTVDMPKAVSDAAEREDRSNIYYADIPGQSSGSKVTYWVTASNATGETDRYPDKKDYTFMVNPAPEAMSVTPEGGILAPGETLDFIASGCYGAPYLWSSDGGLLSTTSGEKTTLTAGNIPGLYTVKAEDPSGICAATATIRILEPLIITPDAVNLGAGSKMEFTASGGEAPYSWKITEGPATLEAEKGSRKATVTASDTDSGSLTLTVTDSKSRTATAKIVVNGPLTLSPHGKLLLDTNKEQAFSVEGGTAPYVWEVVGGNLDTYEGSDVTYQSPSIDGAYTVKVSDSAGNSDTALIIVGEPLAVTPASATIQRGETATFNVSGGLAPYKWLASEGTINPLTGANVTFTPPSTGKGVYELTVADSAGTILTVPVQTLATININPASALVELGSTKDFTATGGSGNYRWTTVQGTLSALSGATVTYTPPAVVGSDTVTVEDLSSGLKASADISIVEKTKVLNDLVITPADVTLEPGGTHAFSAINAKDDSLIKWTASKGTIDGSGNYTAPTSSGTYTVAVMDLLNGRKAEANVYVKSQLSLTPDQATIGTNDDTSFTVSGGEAPYNWRVVGEGDLDATTGTSVTFTASSKTGESKVIVVDNTGISAEAVIEVTGVVLITPASVTLAPGATQQFVSSGGTGTITWLADKGEIDSSGLYTAPSDIGTYTITARDDAGNEATASVTVGNVPVITPAMAWLGKGKSNRFSVVGGTAPYSWSATAGTIGTAGSSLTYKAPGVSGEVTVTVTDALGQESEAIVYVDLELKATREEIFLKPGETARVAVTGGIPSFDWSTITGDMKDVYTEDAGYNFYTAPNVMGEDTITIRDSKGDETTVKVHVTQPIKVTPNVRYMKRNDTKTFTVVSGVPPYTAAVLDGDGDIAPITSDDGVFTFTSGSTANDDVVLEFSDKSGQTAKVHAYVETSLKASPGIIYVDKNSTASFRVSGGTGDYDAIASSGVVDVDPDTGKGTYEAPSRYGNYTISVYDSSDNTLDIKVEVARTKPVISPSMVVMKAGETRTFMVNMGAAPYEWAFEGSLVEKGKNSSTVTITAPDVGGRYKLTVEDAAGNTAEAVVDVNLSLKVSPSNITVFQGTTPYIRINAVGGTPLAGTSSYQWILEGVTEETRGGNYIVVTPSTKVEAGTQYAVTCRDAKGATAKMTIVVSHIPGDINGDGSLSEDEMLNVMDRFFDDSSVQGIKLDPELVYSHIEAFLSK